MDSNKRNMTNTLLVSIIVPVYNVEKYLRKCLDSIINQTYHNIEIILVDDGSKDSSGLICDEYARKDDRIFVYHRNNYGPGAARNYGIKKAKGKYLTFVDSDDWVESNYVETISREMTCDLLYFGMIAIKEKEEPYKYIIPQIDNNLSIEEGLYQMLINQNSYFDFVMTQNKCYQKEIIDRYDISYPEDILHSEDEIFTLRYFLHVQSVKCIDDILYNYNQRYNSESIPISVDEFTRICQYQYDISEMFVSPKMKIYMKTRWLYFNYRNYRINSESAKDIIKRLKRNIRNSDIDYVSSSYYNQRNNKNFYPLNTFAFFVRDIIWLRNIRMLFMFSDLYIKIRTIIQECYFLIRYKIKN